MKQIICCLLFFYTPDMYAQQGNVENVEPLFNGKNLDGWYSFLTSKGKNNDSENIFSIENGILHISGKEFGYICTEKVYSNFHLIVEFKWGTKKYPPRDADTIKRDNGILYYVPLNAKDFVWPKGIECQIQEGDVGDFWMIDSATIVVEGKRTEPKNFCRSVKKKDAEKKSGEWPTVPCGTGGFAGLCLGHGPGRRRRCCTLAGLAQHRNRC